jgi:thiol:disulfide interchange protein
MLLIFSIWWFEYDSDGVILLLAQNGNVHSICWIAEVTFPITERFVGMNYVVLCNMLWELHMKPMIFISSLIVFVLGFQGSILADDIPSNQGIPWLDNYTESCGVARETKQLRMIALYTDSCGWCRRLDMETYNHESVIQKAAEFIPVKLDGESKEGKPIVQRYGINSFPTILFLDYNAREVARIDFFLPPQVFVNRLEAIQQAYEEKITHSSTIPTLPPAQSSLPIEWMDQADKAAHLAQQTGQIRMIDMYTDWCGWCDRMSETTFQHERVQQLVQDFICVKVNAESDAGRGLVERYDVSGYPTILFLDADGELIHKVVGYRSGENFVGEITKVFSRIQ